MRKVIRAAILRVSLPVLACCGVYGQSASAQPAFEVASVKRAVSSASSGGVIVSFGAAGLRRTSDPGRVDYRSISLSSLVIEAYDIKRYQFSGPSWMDSERFDIVAKAPPGADREQVRLMLQNLLAERFKMTLHRERKEMPMYSLAVARSGPKIRESAEESAPKDAAAPEAPPSGGPQRLTMGKDGFPILPSGVSVPGPMTIIMNGRARMQASKETMQDFANILSGQLNRPVVDETALKGKYDFMLYWSPDNAGPMAPAPGAAASPPDGETYPDLAAAIQQQLGLRLEVKKGAVDILVIDRAEKVPTEN